MPETLLRAAIAAAGAAPRERLEAVHAAAADKAALRAAARARTTRGQAA